MARSLPPVDPNAGASTSVRWWRALRERLVVGASTATYVQPEMVLKPPRVWVTISARAGNGQIWTERVDLDGRSLRDVKLAAAIAGYKQLPDLPQRPSDAERMLWFLGRVEAAHSRLRGRLGDKGFRKAGRRNA